MRDPYVVVTNINEFYNIHFSGRELDNVFDIIYFVSGT